MDTVTEKTETDLQGLVGRFLVKGMIPDETRNACLLLHLFCQEACSSLTQFRLKFTHLDIVFSRK